MIPPRYQSIAKRIAKTATDTRITGVGGTTIFVSSFLLGAIVGSHREGRYKRENKSLLSCCRKLWIRCGNEKGGVPFRVGNANPGGSRVEGDATDAEGSREAGCKGS